MNTTTITGRVAIAKAARDLRQIARREMAQEFRRAVREAVKPLKEGVQRSASARLPHRGGYVVIFPPSVRMSVSTGLDVRKEVSVVATISARGKADKRDVYRLNRGQLRHPVFGHRLKPWCTTSIRPGLVDDPADDLRPGLAREVDQALQRIGTKFALGR